MKTLLSSKYGPVDLGTYALDNSGKKVQENDEWKNIPSSAKPSGKVNIFLGAINSPHTRFEGPAGWRMFIIYSIGESWAGLKKSNDI